MSQTDDYGREAAVVHFPVTDAQEPLKVEHVLIDASIAPDKDMEKLLEKHK